MSVKSKEFSGDIMVEPKSSHDEEHFEDSDDNNVFAKTESGPDFRGVTMIGAAVLIAKSQLGLGVLGLPLTMDALGFLPGLISLVGLCIISTWTGILVGKFRLAHPDIYSIGDAAHLLFGKFGREFMGFAFWLFYTLCYGSALITISIAFNTFTGHPICTSAWVGIGAIISFVLGALLRTMKILSWCGYIAVSSIFFAIWTVAIAVCVQDSPAAAPAGEVVDKMIRVASKGVPFKTISSAIATQLLSLCGTASFFNIHAEMKDQKQYVKSLFLGQGFVVLNYIIIASIVYGRIGRYVASPALGSAGHTLQIISYGIALPGLFFSCFFQAHLAAKYVLVRFLRNTPHLQSNTKTHWFTWLALMTVVIILGFVVASAIPFFGDLLGLIGALLGTIFTLMFPAFIALYLLGIGNYTKADLESAKWIKVSKKFWYVNKKNTFITVLSIFTFILGAYICVSGLYGSVASIADGYANGTIDRAFSCADNS